MELSGARQFFFAVSSHYVFPSHFLPRAEFFSSLFKNLDFFPQATGMYVCVSAWQEHDPAICAECLRDIQSQCIDEHPHKRFI